MLSQLPRLWLPFGVSSPPCLSSCTGAIPDHSLGRRERELPDVMEQTLGCLEVRGEGKADGIGDCPGSLSTEIGAVGTSKRPEPKLMLRGSPRSPPKPIVLECRGPG
mmetsp:Transcript_140523/g.248276  ORF Transcript_140523/g.248276 Transcript_140523/m.248276 type:complete len:107 (-) Transcript_140523:142-462(-)